MMVELTKNCGETFTRDVSSVEFVDWERIFKDCKSIEILDYRDELDGKMESLIGSTPYEVETMLNREEVDYEQELEEA